MFSSITKNIAKLKRFVPALRDLRDKNDKNDKKDKNDKETMRQ